LKIRFYKGKRGEKGDGKKGTVLFFHKTSAAKATHYWIPDQVGDDKGYVGNGRERSLRAKKEIYRWFNLQD